MAGKSFQHMAIFDRACMFHVILLSEKKNRCVSVILVRTNWKSYLRGKLAVSAIGSMSVVLIPLLLNMLSIAILFFQII